MSSVNICVQECYRNTVVNSDWHRKLEFPNGDVVVIHSPAVILHVTGQTPGVSWTSGHEVCSFVMILAPFRSLLSSHLTSIILSDLISFELNVP